MNNFYIIERDAAVNWIFYSNAFVERAFDPKNGGSESKNVIDPGINSIPGIIPLTVKNKTQIFEF